MIDPVLAFDTSTGATAAAVLVDGVPFERREEAVVGSRPRHSPDLLRLASEALERAEVTLGEIRTVAVGTGPGSFTGLRVGLAAALGLSRGLGLEPVGVCSLRALIAGAGDPGRTVVGLIDARRGELFASVRPPGKESGDPFTVPVDDVSRIGGPGVLCVGDGAVAARAGIEAAGGEVPPDHDPRHLVLAAEIAALANSPDSKGGDVLPRYVRPPDAVPKAER
ncbi:MAG: tRNA (adenosine(37)-N6)-threonylcarbamoyltransferase complex dimerization subunit type 1 TsaB [Actinomycetes bacterium]